MNTLITNIVSKANNTVWRYYVFTFLRELAFFSAVLVPFYTEWGHISLTQVQILQSWFMLWIFILEVPTGAVADFLGRKYSLALGAMIVSVAALVNGSVPRFEIFLLGEFLFATAMALISGADQALLYDALKEEGREHESKGVFGRANSVRLAGMLIGAPIGSIIASKWGLNYPMLLSVIPFVLASIVAWSIKEPKSYQNKSESKRYLEIAKNGISFFYHHKTLRLLALDAVVVASAAYFVIWLYQPLLGKIGVDVFYFGFVHAFLVIIEILISSNFVKLEKLLGSAKRLLQFSAIVTGLAFLVVAIMPNIITIALLIIFAGGFGLTRLELMSVHMNKHIPSEQRATVLSSISMFRRFALVILNPLIGFAADHSLKLAALLVGLLPLAVVFFSPVKENMLDGNSNLELSKG